MTKVAAFVVNKRKFIVLLFLALIVFSCFSVRWIKVENDITYYLSEDAEARRGLTIMENEFTTFASARVMVKHVTEEEADQLKTQIGELESVALVQHDPQNDYKGDAALFSVTFAEEAGSEESEQALSDVCALLADYDITVSTDIGFSLAKMIAEQMISVLIFVVIVVLAVLIFTSSTYAEIPVMILTFIVAAVINMGTSFLMGTISFVSNSVAIVLQLALSVDYAIIFCNRYKEEHQTLDTHDAVVKALAASIPEISASSLTTIAGLLAMTFMKFRLGADMGLNLIKAIVCSLLTVFLFMPAMLMAFGRAMDKTKHKNFVPKISFVGRFAHATRFIIPPLFVLLVVGAYIVYGQTEYAYSQSIVPAHRQTEYERSAAEVNDTFGSSNTVAVLVPTGDYSTEKALLDELASCDEVKSATGLASIAALDGYKLGDEVTFREFVNIANVDSQTAQALFAYYAADQGEHQLAKSDLENYRVSLIDIFLFLHDIVASGDMELEAEQADMVNSLYGQLSMAKTQLEGENYSRLLLDLDLPIQSDATFAFLNRIHLIAENYYPEGVVLTGESVSANDFRESFASDNMVVSLMSLVLVMIILFFTFKSFGMPLLLILVIQGSIWMNFAIATLQKTPVFFMCSLIVGAIQMGANIDYAIVVSSRYREFREAKSPKEAIIDTMNIAFPTIITSGLMMVCAGLLIGFQVSQCIIAGMGYYVGTGTSISLVLILFALPQMLLLGDKFVEITTVNPERFAFLRTLAANRRRIGAGLLAAAALFALVAAPLGLRDSKAYAAETQEQNEALLSQTEELKTLAETLDRKSDSYAMLKYNFAEQLVTDVIGSEKLEEGETEYSEGKEKYEEGAAQLADAKEQYKEGETKLSSGQAEYDAGVAEYNEALAQYEEAKKQLEEGQAKYDAGLEQYNNGQIEYEAAEQYLAEKQQEYDAGVAQYDAGKKEYAAAEKYLAEKQAEYDAGYAQYQEGMAQYEEALDQLNAVAPLYDAVIGPYNDYLDLKAEYEDAEARRDVVTLALLGPSLAAARIAFETALGGNSISSLIAEYEDGQAQLADAEVQLSAAEAELAAGEQALADGYAQLDEAGVKLADAEKELAAGEQALADGYVQLDEARQQLADAETELMLGKIELDNGYAQLADAEQALADGAAELEAAKAKLDAGYKELDDADVQIKEGETELNQGKKKLDDAEKELESGRKTVKENREKLSSSLNELDEYSDDEEKLANGLVLLMSQPGVSKQTGRRATASEVLSAAEQYFRSAIEKASEQSAIARTLAILLMISAGLALLALLVWLVRKAPIPSALLSLLAGLAAVLCFAFWRSRCPALTGLVPVAAIVLTALAVLFAETLFRKSREAKTNSEI